MIPVAVYVLCSLTALACAVMLLRAYVRSRARLLFWSSVCFFALTIENLLVFVDFVVVPDISLALVRNGISLLGLLVLIYGCIWDV
jgi:hypothetical protein